MRKEYLEEALQQISDEHIAEAAEAARQGQTVEELVEERKPEPAGETGPEELMEERKPEPAEETGPEELMEERKPESAGKTTKGRRADGRRNTRRKRPIWKTMAAVVTAAAVLAGIIFGGSSISSPRNGSALRAYAISEAEYPEMAPYPKGIKRVFTDPYSEWSASVRQMHNQPDGYADGLEEFWSSSISQFLTGSEGKNLVYSPLSVYMALAMTAELTAGSSRQQILDLLGSDSIEAVRAQATQIWEACYWNDGASTSILASSLWLDQGVSYVKDTMDRLAKTYYASSYQGDLSSETMNRALQTWLNEQTGGILEEQAGNAGFSKGAWPTIMALATTLSYQAKWRNEFSVEKTENGVFHSLSGDVSCQFMFRTLEQNYYWGDKFGAVDLSLDNGHRMWFILPDEGVTMDELLAENQVTELIQMGRAQSWENNQRIIIHFYLPRFDVSSGIRLEEGLKKLGVTDVFDFDTADFTPMNGGEEMVCIGQISHAARVTVDEEGVTAAAYTLMDYMGAAAPPEEEIDFRLDRPFLFAIVNLDGVPLFAGVVNQP